MREIQLRLDPSNPGQFYACCGFFELAAGESSVTMAHFVCDETTPRSAEFVLAAPELPEMRTLLEQVRDLTFERFGVAADSLDPVRIQIGKLSFELDWWLDEFRQEPSNLKCWAGQVTTRKLFDELPGLIDPDRAIAAPMQFAGMTKSKFGCDPRAAWNALDFGYSPNVHNRDAATYPIVEVLAALGLQGFRPAATRRTGIAYSLWTVPLPLPVARVAATSPWEGLARFDYAFNIEKRGQGYKYFTFGQFHERKAHYG